MTRLMVLSLFALVAIAPSAWAREPVQVMVLGTWHFDNPGQDLHNVTADDVLTSNRQHELTRLADALAKFQPTKIMTENLASGPDLIDDGYKSFNPATLAENRSETVQIAYRLAHQLGHERVYAIDERGSQYFPFGQVIEFAGKHDKSDQLEKMMSEAGSKIQAFGARQAHTSLPDLLEEYNDPNAFYSSIGGYYALMQIGNAQAQPAAELNAMYYMRNAKIFGKLMAVAEPGDRILVVYGVGHAYWLRHFASEMPGYENIHPGPFLQNASRR